MTDGLAVCRQGERVGLAMSGQRLRGAGLSSSVLAVALDGELSERRGGSAPPWSRGAKWLKVDWGVVVRGLVAQQPTGARSPMRGARRARERLQAIRACTCQR